MRRSLRELYRSEFAGYGGSGLRADALAGLTVAAVALPLALAFGVASGASAAAGLVTAIVAGFVIGALSGAPYQISGPTGAMSAVLILLAQKYGLPGVWVAGVMSGALLLAIGALGLGRFIAFVPAPVISGFTSGIALIIAIGQLDNLLGVHTAAAESAAKRVWGYLHGGFTPDPTTLVLGGITMATMLLWPRRWGLRLPASLLGIVLATAANAALGGHVAVIGAIPQTLILDDRLRLDAVPWDHLREFVAPACTIAALGAIESLLCGAVCSNMTGIRLAANQELIAQGVGNLLLPFAGGVPATAAIARSSVGVKSGGRTRLVSIVQSLVLLASMFALGPVMSRIPLAALAGVLIVTAWRMNEWESIRYMFGRRFKTAMLTFTLTMAATAALDLTQAILVGAGLSALVFLNQIASMHINIEPVDTRKLRDRGIDVTGDCHDVRVAYLTGPLFFAAVGTFNEAFAQTRGVRWLVLSMRGVPLLDTSGLQAMHHLQARLAAGGCRLLLAALQPSVRAMMQRGGLLDEVGADNVFASADQAIVAADHRSGVVGRGADAGPNDYSALR